MKSAAILLVLSLFSGCGYGLARARAPHGIESVHVEVRDERGLDVDAAAQVSRAIRGAVARRPALALGSEGSAGGVLEVKLVDASTPLAPFADPAVRAAQYRAEVRLLATLADGEGKIVWRSSLIVAEAPYLSPPGPLEMLDGARRRALEVAADRAAEALISSLMHSP